MRVFNFSAGPAVLPESVLQQAASEMLDWRGSGMSVMEMSHRGKEFISIADKTEADLRTLLAIPDDYAVLFLQGGAIAENALVAFGEVLFPVLFGKVGNADYLVLAVAYEHRDSIVAGLRRMGLVRWGSPAVDLELGQSRIIRGARA